MYKNDDKFVKKLKIFIAVFGLLSIINIIILVSNKSYALFRRTITSNKRIVEIHVASKFPTKSGADTLKKTLGKGGLIGITENNTSTTNKGDAIREYRYSGLEVNNYVYFNCKDNQEQTDSNCEKWRIIGMFKDENGQFHIKIVRNEVLSYSAMPTTYSANGTSYKIRYSSSSSTAYWNYTGSSYNNKWDKGGLKYWLNSEGTSEGYFNTLTSTAKAMIEDAKWSLGNFKYGSSGDDTLNAYKNERDESNIYSGNSANWIGKIGLMYPSDFGFSASESYWSETKLYSYQTASATSWLQKEANHSSNEWLISPCSGSSSVSYWLSSGYLNYSSASSYYGVRPALYLKSDAEIIDGKGTSTEPYKLNYIPTAVEKVKSTIGMTGGVVGVTTSNSKTTANGTDIREYRYSGKTVNNYVYFNCKDDMEQTAENCEKWRIIGVFKDENEKEHLKIIRNDLLTTGTTVVYYVNEKAYIVSNNYSVWNNLDGASYNNNNWTEAGLMYWLNSKGTDTKNPGYLNSLSKKSQEMIEETKWYLGNVEYTYASAITDYRNERGSSKCTSSSSCSGGYIWPDNQATWNGKIALMYPSDFGFSLESSYWDDYMSNFYSSDASKTWLWDGHTTFEFFLSPSSVDANLVAGWFDSGLVSYFYVYNPNGARPTLYLNAETNIIDGDGTDESPYQLLYEKNED